MTMDIFHPAVNTWFAKTYASQTQVQQLAWQAIAEHQHVLLAAPTGSGKTLAAFLYGIDQLIRLGLQAPLPDETLLLYVSPLKALSTDIQLNLQQPLQGIREQLISQGDADVIINTWVRTGDTPQSERQKAVKKPPHIVVTTPETLYLLLTSASGRHMLNTVQSVIIDEIHALATNKRGAHLSLSLERLQALTGRPLKRIGLSATQKPLAAMAHFLVGQREEHCAIIDSGHDRKRDLDLVLPDSPLQALLPNAVWDEIYDRLQALIEEHRTTLIFVNTRRLAERVARFLAERLGEDQVMSHHGSVAKEKRLLAEQRLKKGELKCMVATASLELGIDIGQVDLVCQLGSPRSISVFLQRVGRSGHAVGAIPKGRLFPLSRDELIETTALLKAVRQGELDSIHIIEQPVDVLAQQIVAEVAAKEYSCDELYQLYHQAWPYRALTLQQFEQIVLMLAQGFSTRRGLRSAHLYLDQINRQLRPRQGSRLTALTNGGVIPDQFDYDVILVPENFKVGTLNEDFAIESMPGEIFQLGNTSYRVLKIEQGKMLVADAHGQPPTIPFWFGEAPGRSDELSLAVSQLREEANQHLQQGRQQTLSWLLDTYAVPIAAAQQLYDYLAATRLALDCIPDQQTLVFERFLDSVGDMHLVIHSPFGSRLNKAWGLALRKRFCRKFNFELQAAALEDTLILSLSATHSFPLEEVSRYLHPDNVTTVLTQAVLDAPLFTTRWRWNACIALAVKRFQGGKRSPAYFQRADAEDLSAVIFPDQLACLENIAGEREIPDHPLVQQTLHDCLYEAMDCQGLISVLKAVYEGQINILYKDLAGPSPMAQEILTARPYAFLDDAPAEERRTQAVRIQHFIDPNDARQLAELDADAIQLVCEQAWPEPRNADECHDALMLLGFLNAADLQTHSMPGIEQYFTTLQQQGRACRLAISDQNCWIAAERLNEWLSLFEHVQPEPAINLPERLKRPVEPQTALIELIRSRLQCLGPVTEPQLANSLGLSATRIHQALQVLEQQGFVIQGHFNRNITDVEWCERHLLARIQQNSLKQRRQRIETVSIATFMCFLFQWHGLNEKRQGHQALAIVLDQLQGFAIAASAWESEILPARLQFYTPDLLDDLCNNGQFTWLRLRTSANEKKSPPISSTPISIIERTSTPLWRKLLPLPDQSQHISTHGRLILQLLQQHGALFFTDLVQQSSLMKTQVENALGELVNHGLLSSDQFAGLRHLIKPESKKRKHPRRSRNRSLLMSQLHFANAGRWSLLSTQLIETEEDSLEFLAGVLLRRYGVVFRKLLEREPIQPSWRDLLPIFWRWEARGEIRGGRFISAIAGEQFALPEVIPLLRRLHTQSDKGELQLISACDPLNLTGILFDDDKIPALPTHKIIYRDGVPVMTQSATKTKQLIELPTDIRQKAEQLLRFRQQAIRFKEKEQLR